MSEWKATMAGTTKILEREGHPSVLVAPSGNAWVSDNHPELATLGSGTEAECIALAEELVRAVS